jgi:hypothetical protein
VASEGACRIGRRSGPFGLLLCVVAVLLAAPAAGAPVPFEVGKPKLNKQKGTATLAVEVPEKGKVSISTAKNLSFTEIFFDAAGRAKLPIRARKGKPIQVLKNTGKLGAKFTVTFAPQGPPTPSGGPSSKVLTITLQLKR